MIAINILYYPMFISVLLLIIALIPWSKKQKEEKIQFEVAVTAMNERELQRYINDNKDKYKNNKLKGKFKKNYEKALKRLGV